MPRLDGIDASHYQPQAGPYNLTTLANIPTWWLAWKVSQSTNYVDPTFFPIWETSRHLFSHRLGYHWISSNKDPVAQADFYLSHMPAEGGAMLDAEEAGITVDGCLAWCERVEDRRKRPTSIYSGLYVAGGSIWKSPRLRESKYGPRAMHLAAYVTEANLRDRMLATGSAHLPMHAWQYSSNGPVAGITGRCDMNRIDDRAIYDTVCGITGSQNTITQPGEDMPQIVYHNAETRAFEGTDYPPVAIKYVLEAGQFRRIARIEYNALGAPVGLPVTNDEINELGEYSRATPSAPPPVAAPVALSGTIEGSLDLNNQTFRGSISS